MISKIIEGLTPGNYGKFLVARFTEEEWAYRSRHPQCDAPLLRSIGYGPHTMMVFDLQTGEGALFGTNPYAYTDLLDKHRIWVCVVFQAFLMWLGRQDLSDITKLPDVVNLVAEEHMWGYRRPGPEETFRAALEAIANGDPDPVAKARAALQLVTEQRDS